jgi:hypothetical protein
MVGEDSTLSRLIALAAVVAAGAVPTALANQGGHYYGTVVDGSRATLTGSATVPSTGGVIASVRVQEDLTSPHGGMFQFGHVKDGASANTSCGSGNAGFFIEYAPSGGNITCNFYSAVFGSQHKFSVLRAADGSGFRAYLDGNIFAGPWQLGFPSKGVAFAVGEYVFSAPSFYDFVWGPLTGDTPWQRTSDHGATWNTVTSGAGIFNDGGWSVGPVPSPFHVSR